MWWMTWPALSKQTLGSGKTALAATLAIGSEFPFMKLVSADNMARGSLETSA